MIDLDEIERRANAATPGPWYVHDRPADFWTVGTDPDWPFECEVFDDGSARGEYDALCSIADRDFLVAARTDVPALIARVRELEAERDQALADYQDLGRTMHEECARLESALAEPNAWAVRRFLQMVRQNAEQMREYGLSYEGVRKVLNEYNDGEISFGKLMDLIRAAARAMSEEECAALRALLVDAHRELATIEAITVSPSGVDGLIELVNRIGQKLESSK